MDDVFGFTVIPYWDTEYMNNTIIFLSSLFANTSAGSCLS